MNYKLRIGFFPDFKGSDTILISGSPADIKKFSERVEEFSKSPDRKINISTFAHVSSKHTVSLWLAKSARDAEYINGFVWVCGKDKTQLVREKLQPLFNASSGHQYFDDFGNSVKLMVSVGEYDERWWTNQA